MKKLLLFLALILLSTPAYLAVTADKPDPARSVVAVTLESWGRVGSGVVVSQTPVALDTCRVTIVTARHVAEVPYIQLDAQAAYITSVHPGSDIALMVFDLPKPCATTGYAVATIDTSRLNRMDRLVHVGFPRGEFMMGHTYYIGQVKMDDGEVLESMASTGGPGSSGGAVFRDGKLIGLLVRGEMIPPFRNYFVPIAKVLDIAPPLSTGSGFSIRSIADAVSAAAS